MEGFVLSTTVISFAILGWLVVAKFGGKGSSSTGCESEGASNDSSQLNEASPLPEPSAAVDMPDEDQMRQTSDKRPSLDEDDSSGVGTPTTNKRLSRRQRKNNRRREKEEKDKNFNGRKCVEATSSSDGANFGATPEEVDEASTPPMGSTKNKKRSGLPCRQYQKLGLKDYQIYQCLLNYKLDEDQLRRLGFPMESALHPGKACVYQDPEFSSKSISEIEDDEDGGDRSRIGSRSSSLLDVNAREFYPSSKSPPLPTSVLQSTLQHSGSTSSVLSATAKEFVPSARIPQPEAAGTSPTHADQQVCSLSKPGEMYVMSEGETQFYVGEDYEAKQCCRCFRSFCVTSEGHYVTEEPCNYHWGKLRAKRRKDLWHDDDRFTCCGAPAAEASRGCCQCHLHVWKQLSDPGMHGPLDGFVRSKSRKCYPPDGNFGIYSMDGEMCYTTNGLELIKLTVVGVEGRLVYESLVAPDGDIIDYNTRFSGISARDLKRGPIKSLREVQNDLMGFVNAHTIIIGHGLENDLRALKVVHSTVIDTSIVFPHFFGLPYRRSLKSLVKSYLKRDIQTASWGHDSYEDARACVELMLWKIRKDLPMFTPEIEDTDHCYVSQEFHF